MNQSKFRKDGYIKVNQVLDANAVSTFRDLVERYIEQGQETPLPPAFCLQEEDILRIAFSSKIVEGIKNLFHEDYIMFPDLEVQCNLFGGAIENKLFSGWHVDSNSEGIKAYLTDKNYGFAKVGIYFQDNHRSYGGGIDLVPASHQFISYGSLRFRFLIKKLINKAQIIFRSQKIPTQKGDMLIFDSRLQHRSSRVKTNNINLSAHNNVEFVELPKGHEKTVLYFDVAFPNSHQNFWNNAKERAISQDHYESRHFAGYTGPKVDYDLFRKYAAAQEVTTIFDVLEQ